MLLEIIHFFALRLKTESEHNGSLSSIGIEFQSIVAWFIKPPLFFPDLLWRDRSLWDVLALVFMFDVP